MRAVQIAELKNSLSAYLQFVRAGEEVLIRDRNVAVAKIVPLDARDADIEEQALVAEGLMTLPSKRFDQSRFWAMGRNVATPEVSGTALRRAMDSAREDANAVILGRKRRGARVRAVPGK
jgi:prevent-host-death family protein